MPICIRTITGTIRNFVTITISYGHLAPSDGLLSLAVLALSFLNPFNASCSKLLLFEGFSTILV